MPDYSYIARKMLSLHDIRVRKWRTSMSGCAWRICYHDGGAINWIEAPRPRSPISLAIFLHEIGHHVIGFDTYRQRCLEELHAWKWAIRTMHKLGIKPTGGVTRRFQRSMQYAVGKALRRRIKRVPKELRSFMPRLLVDSIPA